MPAGHVAQAPSVAVVKLTSRDPAWQRGWSMHVRLYGCVVYDPSSQASHARPRVSVGATGTCWPGAHGRIGLHTSSRWLASFWYDSSPHAAHSRSDVAVACLLTSCPAPHLPTSAHAAALGPSAPLEYVSRPSQYPHARSVDLVCASATNLPAAHVVSLAHTRSFCPGFGAVRSYSSAVHSRVVPHWLSSSGVPALTRCSSPVHTRCARHAAS